MEDIRMADRTASLYLRISQERFEFSIMADDLRRYGIGLEYPGTAAVKVLSEQGDQLDQDRAWLISMLRVVRTISFQWWKNDSEDIYCRIRFFPGMSTIEFGLDGVDENDESLLLDALFGLAKNYVARGSLVGLVVDHKGLEIAHFDRLFLNEPQGR
jgi:hypothetical protein